jgi:hypothetical protein
MSTHRNSLVGRNNFVKATEWRNGVRIDEVATMPGLGGVGFIDKKVPAYGPNSPTPYIQLYCQEKVVTYTAFGSKARGAQNLDQIPARKLPMQHLLDCTGDPEKPLGTWIDAEKRILSEPMKQTDRSFPARMEVRTSLENLLETVYNMLVATGRATKSDAFRHYEKDEWFRWKKLRAEYSARLPGTIFGRKESRPTDWTIIHALLVGQTYVHGLHSRISGVTVERDTANMHSLYLRVDIVGGNTTYRHPEGVLTLRERFQGEAYRPFFPAGVRTLHEYFDPVTGLDYIAFERRMQTLSSAEDKWLRKGRRALRAGDNAPLGKLRSLIKYRPQRPRQGASQQTFPPPLVTGDNVVVVEQDPDYAILEAASNARVEEVINGSLHVRAKEKRDLDKYIGEEEILDPLHIVLRYGRSLGLTEHVDCAARLSQLRAAQEDEGRRLELDPDGNVAIAVTVARHVVETAPAQQARAPESLNPGALDVYHFQRNTPANVRQTDFAIRRLQVQWDVSHETRVGLRIQDLAAIDILFETPMPEAVTSDDVEDDELYRDWLRRVEDPSAPFPEHVQRQPSVNDMAIFIFSSFQHQLLAALPATVRPNKHFPEQEGLPYIRAFSEDALQVSQHIMRDSYSGLPSRLTRFAATQYTADKWEGLSKMFFPPSLDDCEKHVGWSDPQCTYLDLWYGLLERIKDVPKYAPLLASLVTASRSFVHSHKLLPDLSGKVYRGVKEGTRKGPVPIWDDSAHETKTSRQVDTFDPRWLTVHAGDRICNRIRLAYTFTASSQMDYLRNWQLDVQIKEKKPNYAKLYPSPPPFEYPWLRANYQRILPEREYMVRKENTDPARFHPPGVKYGIGHNWWSRDHEDFGSITCSVCRTWNTMNPGALDLTEGGEEEVLNPNDSNLYNRGGRSWGFYACM